MSFRGRGAAGRDEFVSVLRVASDVGLPIRDPAYQTQTDNSLLREVWPWH